MAYIPNPDIQYMCLKGLMRILCSTKGVSGNGGTQKSSDP